MDTQLAVSTDKKAELSPTAEDKFDIQNFIDEKSPKKRVEMAEDFLEHADATWIATYAGLVEKLNSAGEKRDQAIQERIEKEKQYPSYVQALLDFREVQFRLDELLSEGKITPENKHKVLDMKWDEVLEELPVKFQENTPMQETLDWLKQKFYSGDVIMLATKGKEGAQKREIEEHIQRLGAEFALGALSKLDPTAADQLVIVADMIDPKKSFVEALLSIAHERGHEILNLNPQRKHIRENTEVVFEEFFPMMEAQRLYSSLTPEQKAQVHPYIQGFYEVGSIEEGAVLEGTIPGLTTKVKIKATVGMSALIKAYMHSLESKQRYDQYSLAKELAGKGVDREEIIRQIRELKLISTPMLTKDDLNWESVSDK